MTQTEMYSDASIKTITLTVTQIEMYSDARGKTYSYQKTSVTVWLLKNVFPLYAQFENCALLFAYSVLKSYSP